MPFGLNCKGQDPELRKSKEIEKMIGTWMKNYNKSIKLLLLGAGESGKTTIIKQMRILHEQSFNESERKVKAQWIRQNLYDAMKEITNAMEYLDPPISLKEAESQKSLVYFRNMNLTERKGFLEIFTQEFYYHLKVLWADKGVQKCYKRSNEFNLIDSAKYFFDKIDQISRNDYLPSDQDILRCRRRTEDIQKIEFEVKVPLKYGGGSQSFWMFDVGGQRGERRKWIQVFDGITAVLFVAASSGFDLKIREDNKTNRLAEALHLFGEVWNSRFLINSAFLLFLNKQDILREKVNQGIPLQQYFPEFEKYEAQISYDEPDYQYLRAREFIKDKFLSVTKKSLNKSMVDVDFNTGNHRGRECFWHYTTATDTDNISKVFHDIHKMIIIWNLRKISIH